MRDREGHEFTRAAKPSKYVGALAPKGRFRYAEPLRQTCQACNFTVVLCSFMLMAEANLLEQFVAAFETFDDMSTVQELDPVAWELKVGEPDDYGFIKWRPAKTST